MQVTLATKEARRLDKGETGCGRADDLEKYYSPATEIELACSTAEREEFEQDHSVKLTADVLDERTFTLFVGWLLKDRALRVY